MKICVQTEFIGLLLLLGITILLLMSSMMMMIIPVNAFMPKIHSDINDKSLSFLKPDILTKINSGDEGADTIAEFGHREYHSASCDFQGTTENINRLFGQVVSSIDDKDTMAKTFGLLLHPVQDFYAHSNWIELERTDLVEPNSDSKWPVLKPFQDYKGVIIVQVGDERKGEHYDIPDGYTLYREGKVVHVSTSDGTYPGLISATSFKYNNNCPHEDIALAHHEINKDSQSREGYDEARALAEAQTINEWCRLQNLVEQSHGQDGVQVLINSWVDDKHKANSVCLDDGSSLANNGTGSDNGGGNTDTDDDGVRGDDDGGDGGGGGDGFIWPRLINTEEE